MSCLLLPQPWFHVCSWEGYETIFFLYMIDFLVPLWLCKIYVQKSQGVRCVVRNDISKCSNHFPQPDTAASCSGNMSRCFTVQPLSLAYSAKGTMLSAGDRNDGMMGSRKGLLNCKVGTFPLIIIITEHFTSSR